MAASPQELRRMIASAGRDIVDQVLSLLSPCRKLEIPVIFGFRAPVPGYQMDGYMASGLYGLRIRLVSLRVCSGPLQT